MKNVLTATIAAVLVAGAVPAFAQDHGHDHDRNHRMAPPRRADDAHRFRQGQVWHGHHLVYHGGQWGYYQPHNGAQLFIHINI